MMALIPLARAVDVDAERVGLALEPHELGRSRARDRGEPPRRQALRALGQHRPDDLGDDVAGLAHDHRVAGAHVLGPHLVLVVQRGQADGGAADEHRLQHGEGRGPAGAADRHHDVEQGGALLGRELVGDRPPRRLGREAQLVAVGEVVDLHHHAVDLVVEVVAVLLPVAQKADLVEASRRLDLRVDGQAASRRATRASRGGCVSGGLRRSRLVGPELELAAGRDRGVLLAQRAGGGVAGLTNGRAPASAWRRLSSSNAAIGM